MNAAVGTPERILVVALDNVGDVVFTSALTPSLHHAFPDARIDVWSRAYTAAIAGLIPHVTTVIAADPFWAVPPNESRPPMLPFLRSVRAVARNSYDVAIVTEAPWRAAAAVAATGIPIRIGPRRRRNTHLLTHVLPAENPRRPVLQEQARLLSALGVRVARPRYRLDESRLAGPRADVANRLGARFAAFHPFARERGRCVALSEWTQLAFALHARGCPVLWVGTTQELNEIRRLHNPPHGFYADQLPDASLRATAAALSLATLFVGHDSGPLHIAGAFGVPVVGVFAPGQPDRTFPQGLGPWRIIARPSPEGITAGSILREIDALDLASTS